MCSDLAIGSRTLERAFKMNQQMEYGVCRPSFATQEQRAPGPLWPEELPTLSPKAMNQLAMINADTSDSALCLNFEFDTSLLALSSIESQVYEVFESANTPRKPSNDCV